MPDIHDDWDLDEDGNRAIPPITKVRDGENELDPTPPRGWLKVISYCSRLPVRVTDTGSWILCLATVHQWEEKHGRQQQAHMLCRDQNGLRILVVHPDLREEVYDAVETLNGLMINCSCGGYCIEPFYSEKAARVFTRRTCEMILPSRLPRVLDRLDLHRSVLRWPDISLPRRAELISQEYLNPEALGDNLHWLDILQLDTCDLEQLAHEMFDVAGQDSLVDSAFET